MVCPCSVILRHHRVHLALVGVEARVEIAGRRRRVDHLHEGFAVLRRDAEQRAVKDLVEAQAALAALAPGQFAVAIIPLDK